MESPESEDVLFSDSLRQLINAPRGSVLHKIVWHVTFKCQVSYQVTIMNTWYIYSQKQSEGNTAVLMLYANYLLDIHLFSADKHASYK